MGFGGISIWQLLIILAIVILLFGTKRLKGFGSDLGSAVKGFRKAMNNDENPDETDEKQAPKQIEEDNSVIDVKAEQSNTEQTTESEKKD